jgi:SAM-dependent methyltransferase
VFDDQSFDSVLAIEVLQYLPDLKLTMLEIHRVLKSGGNLFGHIPVLGYLRETEHNIFDDKTIQNLLVETGFEVGVLTSTFGGPIQQLCKVFDRIIDVKLVTAFLYPLLLVLSSIFKVESSDGTYRLFVARKP